MAQITVLDSLGATQTVAKVANTGTDADTNSLPVAFSTEGKAQLGSTTETAPSTDVAGSGLNGRLQRIAQRLSTMLGVMPAGLGTTTDSASTPVAWSTEGKAQVGSITETAPGTDTASSGLNGRLQRIAQRLSSLIALTPALGTTTDSASSPVAFSTEGKAQLGTVTETAPGTDTASSGLNGRLQRIAQNLTTVNTTLGSSNAQLPTALGETTRAASLATVTATCGFSAKVTLTRTADTNIYAANDIVGAATGSTAALTFASMGPSAGRSMIVSAALEIDAAAVIAGETSYRLYLYNVTPPSALGDNAAWDLPSGDRASFLGYVDLGTPVDLGSTLYVETNTGITKPVLLSGTSLFGYLVTNGTYTPTSARVYVITLHAVSV